MTRRDKYLLRMYGINEADYNQLLEAQGGCCAICGRPPKNRRLDVDHDHRLVGRSSVRGLLCGGRWHGCNRKLGRIDNLKWLGRVIEYLKNPPAQRILK